MKRKTNSKVFKSKEVEKINKNCLKTYKNHAKEGLHQ